MALFKRSADASAAGSSAGNLSPADPAAALKQRARRRLIGAVVLALTAAVAVPLVLDTKPKPWADDVNIQIPPKTSSYTPPMQAEGTKADAGKAPAAPADATAAAVPEAPKADAAPGVSAPKIEAAAPKAEAVTPKTEAAPAKPAAAPAKVEPAAAKPEAPAAKPAEKAAEKPAEKAAEKAPAKAEAKLEPKQEPKAEPKAAAKTEAKSDTKPAAGKVIVQAGAFQTEDKIKAVEVQVRKAGFVPYRETVTTAKGEITRVRFNVASEEAAKKAIAKLSLEGLSPRVAN
jgi:DedD protein